MNSMKTNKAFYIYILVLILLLTSCKSWDRAAAMKTEKAPFNPKLLTCQVEIQGEDIEERAFKKEERQLFLGEVENNISDPFGDKYGYIELYRTLEEGYLGLMPWILINAPLFQLPLLFGVPMSKPRIKVSYEVRVYNSNRRLLGKYEGHGESKSKIAAYHGYNFHDAFMKIFTESASQAFQEIREQMRENVNDLNKGLQESGKISN